MFNKAPASHPHYKASLPAIWSAMLAVYIAWGSTYLAIRFAVQTMPPFLMAGARFIIAGLLLFIVRRLMGDPLPSWREIRSAGVVGLFLLLGGNGGVVWSEQTVPSGLAALMVSSSPLWMMIIDSVRPGGRRPHLRAVLGILVGFAGVLLLFWPAKDGGQLSMNPLGAVVLLFATFSWACGSIYSRHAHLPASPLMGTSLEMLIGGTALTLLGLVTGEAGRVQWSSISTQSLLGLAYLIVFGSLIGYASYTWLLRVAPTSLVATYAYVNPVVALAVGALFGGEGFAFREIIAAAVILGSVALTTSAQPPAPGKEEPIEPAA
jgi:drug/metabolite transporter (DMT)-like permease